MLERCALRHGYVHSADGWQDVLDPVIALYAKLDIMRFFQADPPRGNPRSQGRSKTCDAPPGRGVSVTSINRLMPL